MRNSAFSDEQTSVFCNSSKAMCLIVGESWNLNPELISRSNILRYYVEVYFIAQIIRLFDKVGSLCRLQCPHCRKSEAVDGYKPLKAYLFFGDHSKIIPVDF